MTIEQLYAQPLEVFDGMVSMTPEGYHVMKARCARVGTQEYRGLEVGAPTLDKVLVYRPKSSVFDNESLKSYAWKPVTNNHPKKPADNALHSL